MSDQPLTGAKLNTAKWRTPKAAAVAGMLFAVLAIVSFWLLWISVPAELRESGAWLRSNTGTVALAVNLMPFSGISFLWFMAVLHERIAGFGDRFFSTVFLGSGILFLCMLFAASAVAGAILAAFAIESQGLVDSATYHFARAIAYNILNVYMIKMAAVFMITTSTVSIYTGLAPRWLAIIGYALALLLLFGSYYIRWSFLLFPLWIFALSACIVFDKLHEPREGRTAP